MATRDRFLTEDYCDADVESDRSVIFNSREIRAPPLFTIKGVQQPSSTTRDTRSSSIKGSNSAAPLLQGDSTQRRMGSASTFGDDAFGSVSELGEREQLKGMLFATKKQSGNGRLCKNRLVNEDGDYNPEYERTIRIFVHLSGFCVTDEALFSLQVSAVLF